MRKIKKFFFLAPFFCVIFLIYSCTPNSQGGYTIGVEGSPAWYKTAPRSDINAYWDKWATYELCIKWEEKYPGSSNNWERIRKEISQTLIRRSMDPLYCSNPSSDRINISEQKVREAEAAEKRAKERERKLCVTATQSYNNCVNSGNTICFKPNCSTY